VSEPAEPTDRPRVTDGSATGPGGDPRTRFVLVRPSHAGNVGATARAMKVMGFGDLVLVRPRWPDVLRRPEAVAMASGAGDVLAGARCVDTLGEALADVDHACATAMTPRDFGPPTCDPRSHLASRALRPPACTAFVFGAERHGLTNEDVWRCDVCLSIPTAPDYGSLNLAQAVQLIAYEWRQALGGFPVVPRTPAPPRADAGAVDGLLEHWARVLEAIGFLDPKAPKKLLPRLRQLLQRAAPTAQEVDILRGIARAVERQSHSRRQ
jgi:tRNA/rRNA methyltransferase